MKPTRAPIKAVTYATLRICYEYEQSVKLHAEHMYTQIMPVCVHEKGNFSAIHLLELNVSENLFFVFSLRENFI